MLASCAAIFRETCMTMRTNHYTGSTDMRPTEHRNVAKFYVLLRLNVGRHGTEGDCLRSVFARITVFVTMRDLPARNLIATNLIAHVILNAQYVD